MSQLINKGGRPPKDRLMELQEALFMAGGLSKGFAYELMSKNKFPKPVKLGSRSVWKLSDIESWIAGLQPTTCMTTIRKTTGATWTPAGGVCESLDEATAHLVKVQCLEVGDDS